MSDELQGRVEKLRRLKAIRDQMARSAAISGNVDKRDPEEILAKQDQSKAEASEAISNLKEDPGGFVKNALSVAGKRAGQLFSKVLPDREVMKDVDAKRDAELAAQQQQPGGTVGTFAGDTLATLPFAGIGPLVRGGRAALGGNALGRAVTSAPAAAALEGAAVGGALNDNAVGGAALGGTLNLAGRALGKAATGPVTKSAEAKALQELAESQGIKLELPVGVAAKNPVVRKAFGDVLPSLPGAQRAMANQKKQLQAEVDDIGARAGAQPQDATAVLGAGIRSPSSEANTAAWTIASLTGTLPKTLAIGKTASNPQVNKALLGDYELQKKAAKLGIKLKPLSEALRRIGVVEGTEDE